MPWEKRGNKTYYYRKQRVDGKVVRTYFGSGDAAVQAEREDEDARVTRLIALGRDELMALQAEAIKAATDLQTANNQAVAIRAGFRIGRGDRIHRMRKSTKRQMKSIDWEAIVNQRRERCEALAERIAAYELGIELLCARNAKDVHSRLEHACATPPPNGQTEPKAHEKPCAIPPESRDLEPKHHVPQPADSVTWSSGAVA